MRVLVVTPHADDEVFGCGGTIARRAAEGASIHVAVTSIGPVDRADGSRKVDAAVRRAELAASCRILGVASHEVLFDGLENRLDTLPLVTVITRLDALLASREWDEVLAPCPSFHQDHRVVHEACVAALRRRNGRRERLAAMYEYPCVTFPTGTLAEGRYYVSIGEHLTTKLRALGAYASQLKPDPEPISIEGARRLAALRGSEIGVEAAERFQVLSLIEA